MSGAEKGHFKTDVPLWILCHDYKDMDSSLPRGLLRAINKHHSKVLLSVVSVHFKYSPQWGHRRSWLFFLLSNPPVNGGAPCPLAEDHQLGISGEMQEGWGGEDAAMQQPVKGKPSQIREGWGVFLCFFFFSWSFPDFFFFDRGKHGH